MICNLCPRNCNIERNYTKDSCAGYCGMTGSIKLARAALHHYEEPCISGENGSGAVFFSGCNLKCIYCQNHNIAIGNVGKEISSERLSEIFLELQDKHANNINLVTGTHYINEIVKAVQRARNNGLAIPIVYNTSGYENVDSLKMLEGTVDIYLPDMKYMDNELATKYSNAPNYPEICQKALDEMFRQIKNNQFENSLMTHGMIVRHLILPGSTKNSIAVIDYLLDRFGDNIYISIMNQYTPLRNDFIYKDLNRKVTKREYEKVIAHALNKGINNGFFQDGLTASESFIPAFDNEGV